MKTIVTLVHLYYRLNILITLIYCLIFLNIQIISSFLNGIKYTYVSKYTAMYLDILNFIINICILIFSCISKLCKYHIL